MASQPAALTALKELTRRAELTDAEIDEILDEYSKGPDRVVAVIGGGVIDELLLRTLKRHMVELTKTEENEIFRSNGPCATFSSRIAMAYALGIIDKPTRNNCVYIKEIRNAFAHAAAPIRFSSAEVSAACDLMIYGEERVDVPQNARERFLAALDDTHLAVLGIKPLLPKSQQNLP